MCHQNQLPASCPAGIKDQDGLWEVRKLIPVFKTCLWDLWVLLSHMGTGYHDSWLPCVLLLFKLSSNQKTPYRSSFCIAVVTTKIRPLDDTITPKKVSDAFCLLSRLRAENPKVQVHSHRGQLYPLAASGLPVLCSQQEGRVRGLFSILRLWWWRRSPSSISDSKRESQRR